MKIKATPLQFCLVIKKKNTQREFSFRSISNVRDFVLLYQKQITKLLCNKNFKGAFAGYSLKGLSGG